MELMQIYVAVLRRLPGTDQFTQRGASSLSHGVRASKALLHHTSINTY